MTTHPRVRHGAAARRSAAACAPPPGAPTLSMATSMLTLDARRTAALLPYRELAAELAAVLAEAAAGRVHALERGTAPLPGGGTFLSMAAADVEAAIVKVGSVHPLNPGRGLPTVQAVVVAIDAVDGRPRALLDGTTVTTRRTAALSLLAAQRLGAAAGTALVVGAGAQALGHVEALAEGMGLGRLLVSSRRAAPGAALVARARELGVEARRVEPGEEALLQAVAEADLVVTTTNAAEPVLPAAAAARLRPGATVVAVGAFTPAMAELPPAVVAACDVVVDTLAGARAEAGDLIQAAQSGAWEWGAATELAAALAAPRRRERPVLFKSVGHSMFDLAAARLALRLVDQTM